MAKFLLIKVFLSSLLPPPILRSITHRTSPCAFSSCLSIAFYFHCAVCSIVALLDLADEHLGCSAFVIALEKQSPALAGLIHSLMYVSGQVVTRPPFEVDPKWVLVGMEI